MVRSLALIPLGLALAVPSALAADKPPISLAKVSKWEINYDEDSCHLFARFAGGKETALLALTRDAPGDWLEMKVFGKMVKSETIAMPVQVAFGAQPKPFKREAVAVTATGKDKLPAMIVHGLRLDGWEYSAKSSEQLVAPRLTPDVESEVTSITFKAGSNQRYRLETGSLAKPMSAMRTCTDDLLRHWGFDPATEAALSRRAAAINNPGDWLRSNDFPSKALSRGNNGLVRFRLDVEADGRVSACRVLYRTNPDEFADLSCKLLMQRARMSPALDAAGKPVRSFYISQIKWMSGDW